MTRPESSFVSAGDHIEPSPMRLGLYCRRSAWTGQARLPALGGRGQAGRDCRPLPALRAFNRTENTKMGMGARPQPRAGPRLRLVLRPGLCTVVPDGTWEDPRWVGLRVVLPHPFRGQPAGRQAGPPPVGRRDLSAPTARNPHVTSWQREPRPPPSAAKRRSGFSPGRSAATPWVHAPLQSEPCKGGPAQPRGVLTATACHDGALAEPEVADEAGSPGHNRRWPRTGETGEGRDGILQAIRAGPRRGHGRMAVAGPRQWQGRAS
jgi:hypothetical protein